MVKRKRSLPLSILKPKHVSLKSKSSKYTQSVITKYHQLQKSLFHSKNDDEKMKIEKEMEALGGLEVYQQASLLGQSKQRGGDSSKWLLSELKKLSLIKGETIKLLDIGALKNNYKHVEYINADCIDLNAQSEDIQQMDFMEMPLGKKYEIICLSLVLNFTPDPEKRRQMLMRTKHFLNHSGLLYIVLPLPCLENSRYLNQELFEGRLFQLGFKLLVKHESKKLYYALFQLQSQKADLKEEKKTVIRTGKNRNNFYL